MVTRVETDTAFGGRRRWVQWLFGLALLAAVVVVTRHFSEARDFARIAEHAEPWWLVVAIGLQSATYIAQGRTYRLVAAAAHASLGMLDAVRLSLAKLFVDQLAPTGGLSGMVVLVRALERRGITRGVIAAVVVVDLVSYYAAYAVCLVLALVIAWTRGEANAIIILAAAVFLVFAIGFSVLVLALASRGKRIASRWLAHLRPIRIAVELVEDAEPGLANRVRIHLAAGANQLAIILCDAATMWGLIRALGSDGSISGVFASFMISSLLRTVGVMPGGLGVFEAASVVTLGLAGVPLAVALAATLLFRGLSFWLPMLPGMWLAHREMA